MLIIEGDRGTRETLRTALSFDGFEVTAVPDGAHLLGVTETPDVIVADIELDVVGLVKARWPGAELVLIVTATTLDAAVAAVRQGAFDFVLRPFFIEDVSMTVACAAARRLQGLTTPIAFIRKNQDLAG